MADTLVYDCFSGISGDMHIGAMLDLGVPEAELRADLDRLTMADEFELEVRRDAKHGISGTRATVHLSGAPGHHRNLAAIEEIIAAAAFAPAVETRALSIFRHIAEAEAKIHDKPIDAVHFHEVGATDSIVDIVAAALCFESLGVEHVYCKTLELGGGMVRCAHGLMPVPAPATAEILAGVPCRYDGIDQEATTPTGAAILKDVVNHWTAPRGFSAERIGYGVGQKDFEIPNVMRVLLGNSTDTGAELETAVNQEIHCNIDDMPAEAFQPLVDQLLRSGALDVYLTPIIMKKARPATKVSVLCAPEQTAALEALLFRHSSTIGVRIVDVAKHMLPREARTVATSFGPVQVKIVHFSDGSSRWKIEHDDVLRIAGESRRDYLTVQRQLNTEVAAELGDGSSESAL
ncbi:MAG: nickel pincer cofactor biosynthesis protein LarC [Pseudomonadota bacterium]